MSEPDRRALLAGACAGAAGCASAFALGLAGRAVVLGPLAAPDPAAAGGAWVDLGPLARLPEGRPMKLPVALPVADAWARLPARTLGNVIAVRRGDAAAVFSAACPHNGCEVFVRPDALVCPCHDTGFALDGAVLHGPSPRTLDPLEVEVRQGRLCTRFQRFLPGVPERRAT